MGAQRVALTALAALSWLEVVEAWAAAATVPSGHVRQAGALASHWVAGSLLTDGAPWVAAAGHAPVCGPRGQGAPVEAFLTVVTVSACRVVQATQAVARQGVTVAHGIGVHVPRALAQLAGLRVPREPQWVPKKAIITDLTAPPSLAQGAVCTHHLPALWDGGAG